MGRCAPFLFVLPGCVALLFKADNLFTRIGGLPFSFRGVFILP
jgi:hypothetical protein